MSKDLKKNKEPVSPPKLLEEAPPQVNTVSTPRQLDIAQRSMAQISSDPNALKALQASRSYGKTLTNSKGSLSFAKDNGLTGKSTEIEKDPNLGTSSALHEKMHLIMGQIQQKYGMKQRLNLAENLYNSIPEESRKLLDSYCQLRRPETTQEGIPFWHEERLAAIFNYLNSRAERVNFYQKLGVISPHESETFQEHKNEEYLYADKKFKEAYAALRRATLQADNSWLGRRPLKKSSEEVSLNPEELEVLEAFSRFFEVESPEFKAASMLANNYKPNQQEIEEAMRMYEGDILSAALQAHKLPVTFDFRDKLKKLVDVQDLKKADFNVAGIPHSVEPFDEHALPYAMAAREAYKEHSVKSVKLNGKHSAGSALFHDKPTNAVWFLKPGSGGVSRAKGVNEESASASRREVAFNLIGSLIGLSNYLPESALILIDNREVAMLEYFTGDYRPVNKIRKEMDLLPIFGPSVGNGVIHRLAALDYLLGQTDRHAGNVLATKHGMFKLIDAGSAFAGPSFDPARDPKSFIPIYMRAFSTRDFKILTPEERFKLFPKPTDAGEEALKYWVQKMPEGQIVHILNKYGINPQPFMDRLEKLRSYPGPVYEFLNKFWAGII